MAKFRPLTCVVIFIGLFVCSLTEHVKYNGHRVIRFTPQNQRQFQLVEKLQTDPQQIDIWHRSAGVEWPLDISGSATDLVPVLDTFGKAGMHAETLINDVQIYIDAQLESNQGIPGIDDDFDYSKYHKIEEIEQWVKDITQEYSNISKMITITKSFEGREMLAIQISVPTNSTNQRPAAFIEGGIHAREWISPATVIYMASQMLENYGKDKEVTSALEAFDWYIVPVVNVDGYAYTWDKERLWRKTRTKHILCYGSDPNRNWDNHWCNGESGPGGRNPCSETYCGPKAFSEPVVKGVADFILSKPKGTFKIFIDFHSYSQLWMSPFGWTKNLPADYTQQEASSKAATEAITEVHGTKYVYGPIATTIYLASGSSADWTYSNASVKYSYGVELRDTGEYGFLLPADKILPSGQETLQGLLALAEFVKNNP
ncbi:hypothetical protein LOTGIDRAFT_204246 [Lottia gigantea]|uniref:Peptidase M14 domain-containing protein n=1 Tax=Lottia gigantea TaxID=225164 RepID=V4AAN0_LOTGI|nr:hypothetical protein LOTGIDRAFT_204246 [Lottia gigantea]ESO90336.1 hypothetical protein LOTGIDRAFT_204246 [Lottia gigantea]